MSKVAISLTGRRPVTIDKDEWPLIAGAVGDEWRAGAGTPVSAGGPVRMSWDPAEHQQAVEQGQVDEYSLHARRHADGRVIVYGFYTESRAGSNHGGLTRAGQLLTAGEAAGRGVESAIAAVGKSLDVPAQLITDCIASLPAEDLP